VTIQVPKGLLDDRPKMDSDEEQVIIADMRKRYSRSLTRTETPKTAAPAEAPHQPVEGDTDPKPW
jgi:hypothetical protein